MSKQDSEPTKEELEQRVNQLEQTVQKMMPNRRQAIKGLGLLGGGALLGGVGSQEAEAATGSAGSVGTSSDRPDVFADTVDSNSLSTGDLDVNVDTGGPHPILDIVGGVNDIRDNYESTSSVGTSATTIAKIPNTGRSGGMVYVVGDDSNVNRFFDLVLYSDRGDNVNTLSSFTIIGTPASRTYNTSTFDDKLDVAMGSDTYNIRTRTVTIA